MATLRMSSLRVGVGIVALGGAALMAVGGSAVSQSQAVIRADGSSTVYPITTAVAKAFAATPAGRSARVDVAFSGTGGGFKKFCDGKTDISNASRPISTQEMERCRKGMVRFIELPVAFDALTVVVNPANTWATSITVDELKRMWEPAAQGKVMTWQQVHPSWPNRPLKLWGPGRDSGTFDYFTQVTMGESGASRLDYFDSEDDAVLVKGVAADPNSLAYFGLAYYEANAKQLKALPVAAGRGPVPPTRANVENAKYQPYSRPLFIYVNAKALQDKPALRQFVTYYLNQASTLVPQVGYIPLPAEGYQLARVHLFRGKVGTVFQGQAQPNLTIGELLRKQAAF